MKRPLILYPFLFALFPATHLYFYNVKRIGSNFSELALVCVGILIFSMVVFFLLNLFFKDKYKSAFMMLAFLGIFFSYGHVLFFLQTKDVPLPFSSNYFLITVVLIGLFYLAFKLKRFKNQLEGLARILNVATACLFILPLSHILTDNLLYEFRRQAELNTIIEKRTQEIDGVVSRAPDQPRDIYYIILDRYASEKVLKEFYGFDNSAFINELRKRGFYVASDSSANYLKTSLSLASSLNMEYLNWLSDLMANDGSNEKPLLKLMHNSKVGRFLKMRKYKFISSFSSPWLASGNKYVDINISLYKNHLCEFAIILFESTILYPFHAKLPVEYKLFDLSLIDVVRKGLIYQFMVPSKSAIVSQDSERRLLEVLS